MQGFKVCVCLYVCVFIKVLMHLLYEESFHCCSDELVIILGMPGSSVWVQWQRKLVEPLTAVLWRIY